MYDSGKVSVIIAAAGSARRMNGVDKMYMPLGGIPVLARTINVFEKCGAADEIVVVVRPGGEDRFKKDILEKFGFKKVKAVIGGGSERVWSVSRALSAVSPDAAIILIQDGARPFVTQDLVERVLKAVSECGAAVPGVKLRDTIKITTAESDRLFVEGTPDRDTLRAVQTPQGFSAGILRSVYERLEDGSLSDPGKITDDASLAEAAGIRVAVVDGSEDNIKITTRSDIPKAEMILDGRSAAARPHRSAELSYPRIGTGFDVHAFADDRRLVIGGVEIPYEKGLAGHSDADVLIHAIMDAALGACALRDIGFYFPDSDPAFEGADSMKLLEKTAAIIRDESFEIINVDSTVIAQAPKLAPYIETMRVNIAAALGLNVSSVGVKATTTERLGFTGRKEGIAAQAAVSAIKNK